MGQKQGMHGSNRGTQDQQRRFAPEERGIGDTFVRALLGQLVNPPNTAISTPMQQATTLAQMGPLGMAHAFGIGADQRLTPGPNQAGLQSREQLGLPNRRDYFTFLPTAAEAQAAGAVPPVRADPMERKTERRIGRLDQQATQAESRGKTQRAERLRGREARAKASQPGGA